MNHEAGGDARLVSSNNPLGDARRPPEPAPPGCGRRTHRVAQEILGRTVSEDLQAGGSALAIVAGLLVTLAWAPSRALRPFLLLFLVLIGAQWLVLTQVDRLRAFQTWLRDPSFSVYMPAEVLLELVVTSTVIAALLLLRRDRRAFASAAIFERRGTYRWVTVTVSNDT